MVFFSNLSIYPSIHHIYYISSSCRQGDRFMCSSLTRDRTVSSHFVCCFGGSTNFDEGKNLIIQHKLWIEPVLQVLSGSCLPSLPKNNITFYWIFSCENNSMELASHGQQVSKSVKCVLSHTFQFYNYDIISV